MNKISGIYQIQSSIKPERIYIGSAVNIQNRWWTHLYELRNNKHRNQRLQNHYNKYGKNDLVFSTIISCDKEDLIVTEQFYLDSYKTYFNICKIARSCLGLKCSEETKGKISRANKGKQSSLGRYHTKESKKKQSIAMKGRSSPLKGTHYSEERKAKIRNPDKISEETREKMRVAKIGKKLSEEHKKKLGLSRIGNKYSLGYKHTEEAKKKMSESQKGIRIGIKLSDEHTKKISEAKKGVKASQIAKINMGLSHLGKKHSISWRQNISNGLKGRLVTDKARLNMRIAQNKRWAKINLN
jgi:group I intron endonuclease